MPKPCDQPDPDSLIQFIVENSKPLPERDPGPLEDPYSYVTAPLKPGPPHLSASAKAALD